jgi:hypothetical protein
MVRSPRLEDLELRSLLSSLITPGLGAAPDPAPADVGHVEHLSPVDGSTRQDTSLRSEKTSSPVSRDSTAVGVASAGDSSISPSLVGNDSVGSDPGQTAAAPVVPLVPAATEKPAIRVNTSGTQANPTLAPTGIGLISDFASGPIEDPASAPLVPVAIAPPAYDPSTIGLPGDPAAPNPNDPTTADSTPTPTSVGQSDGGSSSSLLPVVVVNWPDPSGAQGSLILAAPMVAGALDGVRVERGSDGASLLGPNPGADGPGNASGDDHGSANGSGLSPRGGAIPLVTMDLQVRSTSLVVRHDRALRAVGEVGHLRPGELPLAKATPPVGRKPPAAAVTSAHEEQAPTFRAADLLSSCSPYDSGALERAIDRLIEQLGEQRLGLSLSEAASVTDMLPGVIATAAALVLVESIHRRYRADWEHGDGRSETGEDAGFPELPDPRKLWALEER